MTDPSRPGACALGQPRVRRGWKPGWQHSAEWVSHAGVAASRQGLACAPRRAGDVQRRHRHDRAGHCAGRAGPLAVDRTRPQIDPHSRARHALSRCAPHHDRPRQIHAGRAARRHEGRHRLQARGAGRDGAEPAPGQPAGQGRRRRQRLHPRPRRTEARAAGSDGGTRPDPARRRAGATAAGLTHQGRGVGRQRRAHRQRHRSHRRQPRRRHRRPLRQKQRRRRQYAGRRHQGAGAAQGAGRRDAARRHPAHRRQRADRRPQHQHHLHQGDPGRRGGLGPRPPVARTPGREAGGRGPRSHAGRAQPHRCFRRDRPSSWPAASSPCRWPPTTGKSP